MMNAEIVQKKKKKGSDLDLHLELGVRPNPRTD